MRKAILFASLISLSAFAAEEKKGGQAEFTPSGEFRVRYTNNTAANFSEDGKGAGTEGQVESRFKLGGTFRLGEKVSGHIGTIAATNFGAGNTNAAPDISGDYSTASKENALMVNEAYGVWNATDDLSLKVGRFGLNIADGAVIGTNDYLQSPTAMEGIVAGYDVEFAKFSLLAIKHNDTGPGATATADAKDDDEANTYGLSVDVKSVPDALKMVNIHALSTNVNETAAKSGSQTMRYGLTVGGDTANILYKLTYATYTGTQYDPGAIEIDLAGTMTDLYVGYQMPDMMKFKVLVGYHTDSGDDKGADDTADGGKIGTYKPFLANYDNFSGQMDVFNWGNLTDTYVWVGLDPMENLNLALEYHMFKKTTDKDQVSTQAQGSVISTATTGTKSDLGNEIDLTLTQKYANGVNVGFRYSTFAANKDGMGAGLDQTFTQYQLFGQVGF